jgi:hypothetical protein
MSAQHKTIYKRTMKACPEFLRRDGRFQWKVQSVDYIHYNGPPNLADTTRNIVSYSGQSHGQHGIAFFRQPFEADGETRVANQFELQDPLMGAVIHLMMPNGQAITINHLGLTHATGGKDLEDNGFWDYQPTVEESLHSVPGSSS